MTAVFLDLDGTLMDSRPGITGSLSHAFAMCGMDDHAAGDLTWMIGPPFVDVKISASTAGNSARWAVSRSVTMSGTGIVRTLAFVFDGPKSVEPVTVNICRSTRIGG